MRSTLNQIKQNGAHQLTKLHVHRLDKGTVMENMEKKLEFIDSGKMKYTIRSLIIIIIVANVASAAIIMVAHNKPTHTRI